MTFSSEIRDFSSYISKSTNKIHTEEATKQSFILPFFQKLGFNVFDPSVFVPEFTADIGTKKNEKVDYAIMKDGKPFIIVEAKAHDQKLDNHHNQLVRYFNVTDCKFAILTNGIEYRFFSDLEKENIMDSSPFLTIDLLNLKDRDVIELEKFTSDKLEADNILQLANRRKYISGVKEIFKQESNAPSDEIIKLFASKLINKKLTRNVLETFRPYIKTAFSEIVFDLASERLNNIKNSLESDNNFNVTEKEENISKIVTTEEELEGFFIVKSILAEISDISRIFQRDNQSYFAILLDNNNRKWIARLYFNSHSNKYLSLHVEDKKEEKFAIDKVEDIYNYKDKILSVFRRLN